MKITFIGLSCFLLENKKGERILLDPFHDSPEFSLGLKFPDDIQADLFLVSHPDEDHSYLRGRFIRKNRESNKKDESKKINKFKNLNLKGTPVREYNGDLNIAFQFTLDGMRFLHLADNAHILTNDQLKEFGKIDVLFTPMPKVRDGLKTSLRNIKKLNPKIVIPSHHLPIESMSNEISEEEIKEEMKKKVLQKWIKNPHANEHTVNVFTNMFLSALELKKHFPDYEEVKSCQYGFKKVGKGMKILFFRKCLGV